MTTVVRPEEILSDCPDCGGDGFRLAGAGCSRVRWARCAGRGFFLVPPPRVGVLLGYIGGKVSVQEVAGKVASIVATTPAGTIHLDGLTARLVEARFDLEQVGDEVWRLVFEKGIREVPHSLMGEEIPCFGREREIGLLATVWNGAKAFPTDLNVGPDGNLWFTAMVGDGCVLVRMTL